MHDLLFQSDRTRARIETVTRTDFPHRLSHLERRMIELLARHMGFARTITIREIGDKLGIPAREVKDIVATLRREPFLLPICASRRAEHGGYFLPETEQERKQAGTILLSQARAMIESARALLEPHELQQLLAQHSIPGVSHE